MCLFPMGGGPSMQPIVPPTEAGKMHKKRLMIVGVSHLLLAIMLLFVNIFSGFNELICVMILFCATSQMHFCYLIFYMIFVLNSWVSTFAVLGLLTQQHIEGSTYNPFDDGLTGFYVVLLIIFMVFYPAAVYVCFHAYREFKGMMFDQGRGGGGGMNFMAPPRSGSSAPQ